MNPIFLHSWWRSSSTDFWLKFRRRGDCLACYEPLREGHDVEYTVRVEAFRHLDPVMGADLPTLARLPPTAPRPRIKRRAK